MQTGQRKPASVGARAQNKRPTISFELAVLLSGPRSIAYYSAVRVSVLLSGPCFRLGIQEITQRSVFPLRHRSNYSAVRALLARAYIKSSRHTVSHSLIQLFENLTKSHVWSRQRRKRTGKGWRQASSQGFA